MQQGDTYTLKTEISIQRSHKPINQAGPYHTIIVSEQWGIASNERSPPLLRGLFIVKHIKALRLHTVNASCAGDGDAVSQGRLVD